MKQGRTVTGLIALVASGLALVAVAPAPPAAADVSRVLAQGSDTVEPGNTAYCDNGEQTKQNESSWFRRFDLDTEGIYGDFTVNSVMFGIDKLKVAAGKTDVTVRVRVYRYPSESTLTSAALQDADYVQALTGLAALTEDRHAFVFPIDQTNGSQLRIDPSTDDAVVEVHYAGDVDGERFTIGSNREQESAPGYMRYADCFGLAEISDLSTLPNGLSQVRPVISLEGLDTGFLSDRDRDDVPDDPDVDVCPDVKGLPGGEHTGCPVLTRTVTASYVGGAITGQVGVVVPNPAPVGACLSTQVRAFTVLNGAAVQVGATTDTATDGSYSLAVPGGLAEGSTYFVSTDGFFDADLAVCAAAESTRNQVPTVTVAPPGGGVEPVAPLPPVTPVAPALSGVKLTKKVIHVVGSRATPRATQVKLGLNVAAGVVVTVKGTSAATGKKVKATVSKAVAAGASAVKLTARVGKKTLPPGIYRVKVRATNVAGADTASAGRLRIKP